VPATVLLLILRAQIIRSILGSGMFDWEDTVLTINTLGFFSISLFAQALIPLLTRVFYARHNATTPFMVGLISAVINIVLAWFLAGTGLGVAGLALAFSIANIIQFMLLWLILRMEIGDMDEWKILISTLKFSFAGLALGITTQGMKYFVADYFDLNRLWGIFSQGLTAGLLGLFVYIAFCSMLRSEEQAEF
jgi:putative peptidoglycan lipid II flippase